MKKLLFILIAFLLVSFIDKGHHWYNTYNYYCKYETKNGLLNGEYTSYYPNRKKKAQGVFSANCRVGIWSVWDEKGKLILKRNYENPFDYSGIYPEETKKHHANYKLERDSLGLYKHVQLKEDNIFVAYRSWRIIEPIFNPILFENNRLYNLLNTLVQTKKVHAYANDSLRSLKDLEKINADEFSIVGFKTMEDAFMEKARLSIEKYTIGICPMAVYKNTSDTIELYWLGMDELRNSLVKESVFSKYLPPSINNLDDLFFLHSFSSRVCKSYSFDADNTHYLQKKDSMNLILRADLDMIENEHNIWIYLLSHPEIGLAQYYQN
ncbi:MAG: hypothetical protein K9H61_06605 [Bacteroidia bacterium]|nr:hypothetical protein [Bacteroidia bacterium]MCF8425131.1 hypothetical protein [Bacteroidia bacterium]MCF8446648.1 hypothetical protein [Bacteroidia bacterium]